MHLELTNAFNTRDFDYRLAGYDRTHQLTASYVYSLPKVSRWLDDNSLASVLLDGWQISGVAHLSSGQPLDLLNLSLNTGLGLTGSVTELARVYLRDNGRLRPGPDGLQVDPSVFLLPALIRGNATQPNPWPRTYLRGPGVNNFDIAIYKNIRLGSDERYLQLRVELFNAFNHTQFSSINLRGFNETTNANDPFIRFQTRRGTYCNFLSGRAIIVQGTNCLNPDAPAVDVSRRTLGTLFGDYSSARDPRIIQLAAKLFF